MSDYKEYEWDEAKTPAHTFLLPAILEMLGDKKRKNILDLGCGNGYLASKLLEYGFSVYGVDASMSGIEVAKKRHEGRFFLANLTDSTLPEEIESVQFDTVIATEVIEHLYDPKKFVRICKRILDKNGEGELILSTPYHGYLKNLALAVTGRMDKHFTVLWDGGHIKFWSKETLSRLLVEEGFRTRRFLGAGRVRYLWKSMLISAEVV